MIRLAVRCLLLALLFGCPAAAQDEPSTSPVVLELLLRRKITFTAAELRAAVKSAFQVELSADDAEDAESFVVVKDGMGMVRVRKWLFLVHNPPVARFEDRRTAALACRDPEVATAIAEHRGYATVMLLGDDHEPAEAYRQVARLGAALLGANVLAVGFDGRDLFVANRADLAERLRSDDPRQALSPRQGSGGYLLLASAARPDAAALTAAVRELVPDEPPAITTLDGGRRLTVTIDGVGFVLTNRSGIDELQDARIYHPKARAELLILAELDYDDPVRLARQQHCLAQILRHQAAARPAADVLAFAFWPEPGIRIPGSELQLLDGEDAIARAQRWAADPVVSVAADDPAMLAAIDRARESIDRLRQLLAAGGDGKGYVKFGFVEGDQTEHLWVEVSGLTATMARGTIANDPVFLTRLQSGGKVEVELAKISDWMFVTDGEREGGFSIAVLQARAAKVCGR
jgi:uncharacterized protein YegJ (DUF2314 family)